MLDEHRALEPPDPIPNSVVKRCIADGSVGSPHVRVGHRQASNKQPLQRNLQGFFVCFTIIPAVTEEFFFRGMLQTYFIRLFTNKHFAIFFTAAIFSILHADIYNFIPRTIMGCMYGYIFIWYGNLWIPIIAHFMHNASVVIVLHFISKGTLPQSVETIGELSNNWVLGTISVLFVSFVSIRALQKQNK